jgi:hypothetical protein
MNRVLIIAILLVPFTSSLECLAGTPDRTVFIIGKVEPSLKLVTDIELIELPSGEGSVVQPRPGEMSVTIMYEGKSIKSYCRIPDQKAPPGTLCYDTIFGFDKMVSAPNARLEVIAPGYKKFSKNLPSMSFTNNVAVLTIGSIRLQQSDLPTVAQVVRSRTADGSHRFEITLHNRLKRDFLIREVTVAATIPDKFPNVDCCCPPNSIFKIGDTLKIAAGGGEKRMAAATFEELVRGKGHTVEATGSIKVDGCRGGEELVLTLPTSFILPASQYIAVPIIFPSQFRIADAFYGFGNRKSHKFSSEKPSLEHIGNGKVDRFRSYRFIFRTSMEDELDIIGSYKVKSWSGLFLR